MAALNYSCRAQKSAALQQWTILSTKRPLHDACVCRGARASTLCFVKPVLTQTAGRVPRLSTLRARLRTSLYYLLEDRSLRVPGADPGRVSRATLACRPSLLRGVAPAPRRPQRTGSGRGGTLKRADGAVVERTKRPCRRARREGATLLVDVRAAASRRRADLIEGALHGADVKRRRRRRAGDDVRAAHGPPSIFAFQDAP